MEDLNDTQNRDSDYVWNYFQDKLWSFTLTQTCKHFGNTAAC